MVRRPKSVTSVVSLFRARHSIGRISVGEEGWYYETWRPGASLGTRLVFVENNLRAPEPLSPQGRPIRQHGEEHAIAQNEMVEQRGDCVEARKPDDGVAEIGMYIGHRRPKIMCLGQHRREGEPAQ